ncbi:MAG: pantothenate kinase [Bacteroidetes bacterium HGW-Bacteroidetes-3]|jgi:type III pantothenate kinase|nr:MAG: pantothenate kinase [Bacteroidetes bacterium HGW-Bacteroidetes-3]
MNLIIDVGNTRIKTAVFDDSKMIHNESLTFDSFVIEAVNIIKKYNCKNAIISSVGAVNKSKIDELYAKINLLELNYNTKVPFMNKYSTPKTLGVDRIALVSSAIANYPNRNVLIIDAGTCITYDFVNNEGIYYGGAISPGLQMRYKALNFFTEKLPLLEPSEIIDLVGNSTESSIHSGVINGVINEIDGIIKQYRKKNTDLTVVLTGGDVNFLANRLKNGIFANPNFLLEGLNTILTYNL